MLNVLARQPRIVPDQAEHNVHAAQRRIQPRLRVRARVVDRVHGEVQALVLVRDKVHLFHARGARQDADAHVGRFGVRGERGEEEGPERAGGTEDGDCERPGHGGWWEGTGREAARAVRRWINILMWALYRLGFPLSVMIGLLKGARPRRAGPTAGTSCGYDQ